MQRHLAEILPSACPHSVMLLGGICLKKKPKSRLFSGCGSGGPWLQMASELTVFLRVVIMKILLCACLR